VTPCHPRARRAIGLGLLIPGLLLVPPGAQAADTAATPTTKRLASKSAKGGASATAEADPCVYFVRSGDSVSKIAARQRVPRQRIIDANHLARPEALRVGQRLIIPGCDPTPARLEAVATRPVVQPDGSVVALVGPRRIPTRMYLNVPELGHQGVEFAWPVLGPVISAMGARKRVWHAGIDIQADLGTPVYAAAPGDVYFSGSAPGYGRVIKIEHLNGFMSIYAHNLENLVNVGDRVDAGAVIATVGKNKGAVTTHLHFEIRRDGMAYNPLSLLPRRDVAVARSDDEMPQTAPAEDDEDE
jgi:murein DD-endopeptidase MepM/ murein hydrolase activator NlpD